MSLSDFLRFDKAPLQSQKTLPNCFPLMADWCCAPLTITTTHLNLNLNPNLTLQVLILKQPGAEMYSMLPFNAIYMRFITSGV